MQELNNIPPMPHYLRIVAEGTGRMADALKFASEYGGQKIYIPTKIDESSEIYERLGREILKVLIDYCNDEYQGDGRQITVPLFGFGSLAKFKRDRNKIILNADGKVNQIVKLTGASRSTVCRVKAKHKDKCKNKENNIDLISLMEND